MFVKPANLGSSVGISKAHNCAELEAALALAAQFDRKIIVERGIDGPRIGMRGAGQRRAGGFHALRDSAFARVLRLRRQVPARSAPRPICPPICPRSRRRNCAAWRSNATARWSAKAWGASISCWKRPPASSTSTRSIPFPDSPRSACIPRCGKHAGLPLPKLIDRLIELALERHRDQEGDSLHAGNRMLFCLCLLLFAVPAPATPTRLDERCGIVDAKFVQTFWPQSRARGRSLRPPSTRFIEGAIPGMLRTLDPHSVFFDPGQFEQLKQMECSDQQGLRHRGFGAAGPRDRAADAAGHAFGESRDVAGRRNSGGQQRRRSRRLDSISSSQLLERMPARKKRDLWCAARQRAAAGASR